MNEIRIERALRQGPPFRTHFVAQPLPLTSLPHARAGGSGRRLVLLLVLLGVIVVGGVAALSAAGLFRPEPQVPRASLAIVLERSNGQHQGLVITHHSRPPGADDPVRVLRTLPDNAILLDWSPDGSHLAFLRWVPTGFRAFEISSMFVADGDGRNAVEVAAPRPPRYYGTAGWYYGPAWSPDGTMVAIHWDTHRCSSGPNCPPDTGTDIFDASGGLVLAMTTPNGMDFVPMWSPDSTRTGWSSGSCRGQICAADAFHYRSVRGSEAITTLSLPPLSMVAWSTTDRLLVTTLNEGGHVARIYSSALDGTDETAVAWEAAVLGDPLWSPDGRRVAGVTASGRLTIRDTQTGEDVVATLPTAMITVGWSPDGRQLILAVEGAPSETLYAPYEMYSVNADGSGLQSLGDAQDLTWRPTGP